MSDTVSSDALEWALTHIERFGDSDFFPLPFEYKAIRYSWTRIRDRLLQTDLNEYRPSPPRRLTVPKSSHGFRVVVQLDPLDALLYTAMIYEAAQLVEASRIQVDQRVACSYRIETNVDGSLFTSDNGWPDYHQQSKSLAESGDYKYVVIADITDFYNQVSQHRIENALELAEVPETRAKAIEEFLASLTAKHHSRGLPVGPAASIVLAEACLNDVDNYLMRRGIKHTRYVDDFRIFCQSQEEAIKTLHDLVGYLHTSHRLTFNPAKTRVVTTDTFLASEVLDPEEDERRSNLNRLKALMDQLIEQAGGYGELAELIDIEEAFDSDDLNEVMRDNLAALFVQSLEPENIHLGVVRHLLRRAANLRTNVIHDTVVSNLDKLAPVLRDVALYFKKTHRASSQRADDVLLFMKENSFGSLPFCRMWGTEIIINCGNMDRHDDAMRLTEESDASIAIRCQALIARKSRSIDWVRERKENWPTYGPWDRRAIIFAAGILPRDERNPWLRIVSEQGDILDSAVADYVRATSAPKKVVPNKSKKVAAKKSSKRTKGRRSG